MHALGLCPCGHPPGLHRLPRCWLPGADKRAGQPLLICQSPPATALPQLAPGCGCHHRGVRRHCRPYEQAEVAALRAAGLAGCARVAQQPAASVRMPWPVDQLPGVFTTFRQKVERAGITPAAIACTPSCCRPPGTHVCFAGGGRSRGAETISNHAAAGRRCPLVFPTARLAAMAARLLRCPPGPVPARKPCPTATGRAQRAHGAGLLQQVLALAGHRGAIRRARLMPT